MLVVFVVVHIIYYWWSCIDSLLLCTCSWICKGYYRSTNAPWQLYICRDATFTSKMDGFFCLATITIHVFLMLNLKSVSPPPPTPSVHFVLLAYIHSSHNIHSSIRMENSTNMHAIKIYFSPNKRLSRIQFLFVFCLCCGCCCCCCYICTITRICFMLHILNWTQCVEWKKMFSVRFFDEMRKSVYGINSTLNQFSYLPTSFSNSTYILLSRALFQFPLSPEILSLLNCSKISCRR